MIPAGEESATAGLYEQLRLIPANAAFRQAVEGPAVLATPRVDLIGVVRGAFHQDHHHTGADGARVFAMAREWGIAAEAIPTGSFGSLEESARTVLQWLEQHSGRRIALVSLSKGSAEVKRALASPRAAATFAPVAAWISLSGMTEGTLLVEWLRQRPLRWWGVNALLWWKGYHRSTLEELSHQAAAAWPRLPTGMRVVHICGFPLRSHLSHRWAVRAYDRLSPLGPNDGGGILLASLLDLPGIVFPVWGADHYLSPHWDISPLLHRVFLAAFAART